MDLTLGGYWIKFSKYQISGHASSGFSSQTTHYFQKAETRVRLTMRQKNLPFDHIKQNSPRSDVVKIGRTLNGFGIQNYTSPSY
jgi:hypothetical protein